MSKAPPPPRLTACLLCLPVLFLAGAGGWALLNEQTRAEAELRREARELARGAARDLNTPEMLPRLQSLEVLIPSWQLEKKELPAAGSLAADYFAILSPQAPEGERAPARSRLEQAWQSGELLTAVSPSGLPLMPLAAGALGKDVETVCQAALRQPNELTERLIQDATRDLPGDRLPFLKERAGRAMKLVSLLRGPGPTGTADTWLGDWYVKEITGGLARLQHPADILHLLTTPDLSGDWRPPLPPALTLAVTWHQRPVTPADSGEEVAVSQAGPWQVTAVFSSPGALRGETLRRTRWLMGLLAGALGVTAFSLWVTWRAFRKQAQFTRLQSEFVASVSHELRTPVAGIGVLAERLEQGKADATQTAQYHHFIVRECRRLAALVTNVLDFSRIERGRKQYDLEPADLPGLTRETTALMRPAAEEKGLVLTEEIHDVPEDLWPLVDAVAIRQALVNLLENAIKFTPSGGRVTVTFGEERGAVHLRVRDTGTGIPRSEHRRIFERFHRVDNGLTRETPGAGIGLSLVEHIVLSHGGTVRVDSEPGKGSTFTIQFPKAPPVSS